MSVAQIDIMEGQRDTSAAHREASDGYSLTICRFGDWRVIVCAQSHQWIVQRAVGSSARPRWKAVRYFRQRWALLAFWHTCHQASESERWPELEGLPEYFSGGHA